MNKKTKFIGFLASMTTESNKELMESVKNGFGVCFEGTGGLYELSGTEDYNLNDASISIKPKIRNQINRNLSKCEIYYDNLSEIIQDVKTALNPLVLLVDDKIWDGAFTGALYAGDTYQGRIELGYDDKKVKNAMLMLNIYKMDSTHGKKYELNAYIG